MDGMSKGISLNQILHDNGPWPTYILNWGEDMPPHIVQALWERDSFDKMYDEALKEDLQRKQSIRDEQVSHISKVLKGDV